MQTKSDESTCKKNIAFVRFFGRSDFSGGSYIAFSDVVKPSMWFIQSLYNLHTHTNGGANGYRLKYISCILHHPLHHNSHCNEISFNYSPRTVHLRRLDLAHLLQHRIHLGSLLVQTSSTDIDQPIGQRFTDRQVIV